MNEQHSAGSTETSANQEAFVKAIEEMADTHVKLAQQLNTCSKLLVDLSKRVQALELNSHVRAMRHD